MSTTPQTPSPFDAARIEREQAEAAKLREERAKLRAQRREIELRLAKPWYRTEGLLKAVVGGLLALPVMWFFFDQIIRPVYTVENKKLWVDVEEARLEIRLKERALGEAQARLAQARRELEAAWAEAQRADQEISRRETALKGQQAKLVAEYERLLAEEKSASAELAEEVARLRTGLTATRGAFGEPLAIHSHRLQGDGVTFVASPLEGRPMEAKAIVFHTTASSSLASTVTWLRRAESGASVHLLIGRDGAIVQMVPLNRTAAHAGKATLAGGETFNRNSISISLANAGRLEKEGGTYRAWFGKEIDPAEVTEVPGSPTTYWHKPTPTQLNTAEAVTALLVEAYPISRIVGHDEISGGLEDDPGPAVPVEGFRERFLAAP